MRSIWKGSISFGLVNIPVAVYPATREEKVAFKQLRRSDHSAIRYKKVAEADEKEVPTEEIVKGFEHEKGKFVIVTDEDFEKVKIESTHTIEITDFVEQAQINPKFFYKPYFLEPQKGGEKGYSLLHHALVETAKLGIAKVAIKNREYLAAVKPDGLFLILELMHFPQEVLEPESLKSAADEVPARELDMAKQLIGAMTTDWEPGKYQDQYQTALRAMIEEKIQMRPASPQAAPAKKEMVGDILAILQQSLAKAGEKKKVSATRASRAARPAVRSARTPKLSSKN
jgi:DNA end-binding protein Ku